ncbi:MAG: glycogen-binding domain-containing protein [Verrucomicrobiota bacterium]|nr:glycogen-binding domain-containing protein [Verrucomicrobiota bacterium]MCC6822148.1 glycogen-binding domain-containing protein [Limisphaerales bacterium]
MLHRLNDLTPRGAQAPSTPRVREATTKPPALLREDAERKPTYAKVFRWQLPAGQTVEPKTVEIIGSFTEWQRVPLARASGRDSWEATLSEIAGHRTHHYMLLVDGLPAQDKNCDGLAIPHGPQEQQYALTTPRGPRLFMLFAQTK